MRKYQCMTCSAMIDVDDDILVGEIVECGACGQEHELIKQDNVLKLDFAPEVEEDWGE
ncbi:lysine biosynthesis protein LysW [Prodigiosinella confusarubida]|uniref:Lysine biosynthesis protein LysW n=1 Tax=Serratia sp. (strain ATCC 39006) TaxID=104623 RepID=A0A2I5T5Y2_SERS3|nr:alpha-aminoadipate/glutamate carrier protein LysW [Serratia sp. ATCC 39006]AUG99976.1 lysine biosynthesis protein LysW [Serratia sp. ATCC 39006]AUH04296.1 lysine biosynthesis protein LysW [Serratia sp. ATCC 39006]